MQSPPLPQGFRAAGVACGIKESALDLALFASDVPCASAGVFTQNLVCGAPVKVSRKRVPAATTRAVIINSGNANACTGEQGIEDALWMTQQVAQHLSCAAENVLVCSTGVIGRPLPREKLAVGIPDIAQKLAPDSESFADAARGMMTTDTRAKQATRQGEVAGRAVRVSGAAKGAAMIGPNMATMLCVLMTDAQVTPAEADGMLRRAVDQSFNCISVEGHTSTSDTVLLLANGAAGTGPLPAAGVRALEAMIADVSSELAQAIVVDAEGASHFIQIDVRGLRSMEEAARIAKTIANDALVKTAIAGGDPNWGRVVSAAGRAGVRLTEQDMSLSINGTRVFERGAPVGIDTNGLAQNLRGNRNVHLDLELALGDAAVRFWTSDLTAEYVRLNSDDTT